MDETINDNVVAIASKVANYGGAIAGVLTNHLISVKKVPEGLEGVVSIVNATVATLQQVSNHVKAETDSATSQQEKRLLSQQGLDYVRLLATECAVTFLKIAPTAADACLDRKELRQKRKLERKALAKKSELETDIKIDREPLILDTDAFAETVDKVHRLAALLPMKNIMARLHEIQLHLLLVHQVVSLGQLSCPGTPNKIDIKSVVAYHERVGRTARLIGIEAPGHRVTSRSVRRNYRCDSDSNSDSLNSSSDSYSESESDYSTHKSRKSKKPSQKRGPPSCVTLPPPPPPPGFMPNGRVVPTILGAAPVVQSNPPAYSEAQRSPPSAQHPISGMPIGNAMNAIKPVIAPSQQAPTNNGPLTLSEKLPEKAETPESKAITTPTTLEPRLLKSKSYGITFKIKSFFRSKQSLAEEMKKALGDTDSILRAFVIRGHETRLVPHSAFHTLETTHMQTILSQLNDNTWYKTFSTLKPAEHQSIDRLLNPFVLGKTHERNIVVLKVLEDNGPSVWMVFLRDLIKKFPTPHGANDRVILAIVREKLVDGKPLPPMAFGVRGPTPPPCPPAGFGQPPPPPPAGFNGGPPMRPIARPPPDPSSHVRHAAISDLAIPPAPLPYPSYSIPPPCPVRGPPGPPGPPRPPGSPPANTIFNQRTNRPLSEHEATQVLTSYKDFTLRLTPSSVVNTPLSWSRVSVTHDNNEDNILLQRIHTFNQKTPSNIVEAKLRMNEHQNKQLSRLMEELQAYERDASRFEWCWAEISLYDDVGEIVLQSQAVSAKATTMHVIAKRALKTSLNPIQVYRSLTIEQPPPPQGMYPPGHPLGRPPGPPVPPGGPPIVVHRHPSPPRRRRVQQKKYHRSRYDSESSGSSSDSTSDSDSDSDDGLRTVLRKNMKRRVDRKRRAEMRKRRGEDTDSFFSESESEEDPIDLKLDLKKGDDVVKVLLDLWTPQDDSEGKTPA
ncbi:hypothetical protein VTL71DRAFT_7171 [Oculimacula yallundae]|uniref:Uncharacterized protein n=1 Tax=Oculimacula yallundae TaxID=86028 RepID=A0ABR4BYJ3_9HELO